MEPAEGEEAEPGPQPVQAAGGEESGRQRDESEPVGPEDTGEPPRLCGEASAAAWARCWEPAPAEDAREPLLPGREDAREPLLPGREDARGPLLPGREDAREPLLPGREDARGPLLPGREDAREPLLPGREDAREPLLPGREEPPARGASLPAGHDPPAADAAGPVLPRGESPAPRGTSPGSESVCSSILSLFGEAQGTSSHEVAVAAEDECPICTEPYDEQRHKPAVLNCSHGLCRACLRAIMATATGAELGRVRCPICRQKTPMLEWEICKLQEELLLLHAQPGSPGALAASRPPALPPRRPGLAGALEHRFQVRFHTSRMFGCLPCVRYPPCLIRALARLERRCRCCYLLLLALLLAAEMLSLLLIFLPIVLMVMLFLILDK